MFFFVLLVIHIKITKISDRQQRYKTDEAVVKSVLDALNRLISKMV